MKITIMLMLILSSAAAQAVDVYGRCMTEMAESTTFEMKTHVDQVQFQVTNHNGGQYAPFWSSIVVPHDLSLLTEKAEMILKLDRGFKASFPVSSCSWVGENKFSCMDFNQKTTAGGLTIYPWALYSSVITDSSFAGEFKYTEMTVLFKQSQRCRDRLVT